MRGEERDEAAMVVGGTADLGFNATKARCNNHAVHAARILVRRILAPLIVAVWLTGISPACAQTNDFQKWDHYGGGDHGMQYSSLSQITTDNVGSLEEAWRFRTGELGQGHREPFAFQANPILVEGRLYLPTGSAIVFALDPATGREIWRYDPKIDRSRPHAEIANRGVTSWVDPGAAPDVACRHRIFVGTLDARLIALDGATGKPCEDFGEKGQIWLNRDVRADDESEWVNYTVTSPPVTVGDVVVVGSAIGDNRAVESELGIVRGIDARSGEERWRWDPIPRDADDPAYATWQSEEAARNGSANAWAPLAADPELGLVYVPTGSASPDFYGGEREGDNLYANSLVALHAYSGEIAWYQQLVHHDVWDYDLAAQPTLVDLEHEGETIAAVLQGTKTGHIFSFDRRTGEPIFAIEERPVPQGGVEGEHLSPTQPFPVAPPSVASHDAVAESDAWGMLYFDKRACRKKMEGMRSEGIFTPPSLEGTIQLPGYGGGINWGGLAFDPDSQTVVTFSMDLPMAIALIPRDDLRATYESGDFDGYDFARMNGTPYGMRRRLLDSPLGTPCTPPPWGWLASVDMRGGKINWQRKVGSIQDVAPAIVPNLELGMGGLGGPVVTAGGLIFMGTVMDDYLRAFDLANGETLWEGRLPAGGQATPMTYYLDETGKQYVVIAAGGHARIGTTSGDYVIAYALPD
jgi:quinoprotein glucose dehydrogenase